MVSFQRHAQHSIISTNVTLFYQLEVMVTYLRVRNAI